MSGFASYLNQPLVSMLTFVMRWQKDLYHRRCPVHNSVQQWSQISFVNNCLLSQFKFNAMGTRNQGIVVSIASSYRLDILGWQANNLILLDILGLNPGRDQRFSLLQKQFMLFLGPTQPPLHWVKGFFPGGTVAEAWSWPLTSTWCWG